MTDIRRIGDAGIHTVEGNVAGSRAALLTKQREAQQQQYESVKQKIKDENASGLGRIDDKFSSGSDHLEQEFKRRTVGLVSADAFRKARVEVDNSGKSNLEAEKLAKAKQREAEQAKKEERAQKRKKSMASSLSFSVEDDDDEETRMKAEEVLERKKKKLTKNPNVDTSYLPDKERDEALQEEKERLRQEWIRDQEKIKNELLCITYSYWDGSGHRKEISVKKGTSVGRFLELVKQQLVGEFHEMRLRAADSLLYVKEDLIIPHHLTFYDLIVTKARGKSGPLFHFDVHDDVRMLADATVEKEESHPGKVVDRHWYEKNKHIFPASRWEVFDPTVKRTDKYTIHGSEVN